MLEIVYQSVNISNIDIICEKSIIPSPEFISKFVEETDIGVGGASRKLTGRVHDFGRAKRLAFL